MKKILFVFLFTAFAFQAFSQSPSGISYQAVIRDADYELIAESDISMQVSIMQDSSEGVVVFYDEFIVTTNINGLASMNIEDTELSNIDWRNGPFFIKIEADITGDNDYSIVGVNEILTVPYAFHSNTAGYAHQALEFDPLFTNHLAYNISDLGSGLIISDAERNKLLGIEDGAQVNIQSDWQQTNDQEEDFIKNKPDLSDLHTHTNHDVLDAITSEGSGEIITTDERIGLHHHSNHDILDQISNVGSGEIITTAERGGLHQHANYDILNNISSLGSGEIITINERLDIHAHTNHDVLDAVSDAGSGNIISTEERNKLNSIKTYEIGDFAHGGIVFWVDETGQHGLVVAKEDQSNAIRWHAGTNILVLATGSGPYAGKMNTTTILAQQGYGDEANYAARLCAELVINENGFDYADWYLPSLAELQLLYDLKDIIDAAAINNGGNSFAEESYWSSNQLNGWPEYARSKSFVTGGTGSNFKNSTLKVRAVRRF